MKWTMTCKYFSEGKWLQHFSLKQGVQIDRAFTVVLSSLHNNAKNNLTAMDCDFLALLALQQLFTRYTLCSYMSWQFWDQWPCQRIVDCWASIIWTKIFRARFNCQVSSTYKSGELCFILQLPFEKNTAKFLYKMSVSTFGLKMLVY